MRIVFNFQEVGLGNNGGTRTIIKCAETLQNLGHEVILSSKAMRYTWHKTEVKVGRKIPDCDIIVATGYRSVGSTLKARARAKFYYVRGLELWNTTQEKLLKSFRSLRVIVNSSWLRDFMSRHNIECDLIYPGLDFDSFFDLKEPRKEVIGGLFSSKHRTKKHGHVAKIAKISGYPLLMINRDIKGAGPTELCKFYNKVKVWVSSSELEGLHNCPMEASLCGCGSVISNHPRGGTGDYAIPNKTCLVYNAGDLESAAEKVNALMQDDILRNRLVKSMNNHLRDNIGDRTANMSKLVSLFEAAL